MVATSAAQSQTATSILRPVHPRRDLGAIADLIETCFADALDAGGRAMLRDMRLMANTDPLLWAVARLTRAIPPMSGYVWVDDGQLVGNVTITPAGYGGGMVIANVAVSPTHRRRGIARQLMDAAMNHVAQRGRFAVLQVDADNAAARHLYNTLGFHTERTFTRWRRGSHHRTLPYTAPESIPLHRMRRHELHQLVELADELRPNSQGGMGWLRPTSTRELQPPRLGALHYLFSGKQTTTWVVPGTNNTLDAALRIEQRMGSMTVLFDLLVRPQQHTPLVAALFQHALSLYPRRPLMTDHPAEDSALIDLYHQFQFRPERTLVHMVWPVPSE